MNLNPSLRLHPALPRFAALCGLLSVASAPALADQAVEGELLIGLRPSANTRAVVSAVDAEIGTTLGVQQSLGVARVKVHPGVGVAAAAAKLRARADVAFVEPNYIRQASAIPNDPNYSTQYGPRLMQAERAWDVWAPKQQVVVAVVDTGVQGNHPDLTNQMYRDAAGNVIGWNTITRTANYADDNGHGTHCAGTVAASINNGVGVAGVAGWNPAVAGSSSTVRIMPIKVLAANGSGTDAGVADGITWAVDRGANVVSLSLGGTQISYTLQQAVDYATSRGVVIVAAAGNAAVNVPNYPAACNGAIAVAASDASDVLTSFSNWGSWVTVSAPGLNIYSTAMNSGYTWMSGTSMATPHVAGAVALLKAHSPTLTPADIKARLVATADKISNFGVNFIPSTSGRVNIYRALTFGTTVSNSGSASFVGTDATTKGNWKTAYGADGQLVAAEAASLPAYATASFAGQNQHTWAVPTTDGRAAQRPGAADRIASCWYTGGSFTIDVNVTGADAKPVSLYFLDWDAANRNQRVDIIDTATGVVHSTQSVTGFSGGVYYKWNIKGRVQIKVTNAAGMNAVMSGVFFGAAGSTTTPAAPAAPTGLTATPGNAQVALSWTTSTGAATYNVKRSTTNGSGYTTVASNLTGTTYTDATAANGTTYYYVVSAVNAGGESANSAQVSATPSAPPAASGPSAAFIGTDTTTAGTWQGVYGADGRIVANETISIPAYATAVITGQAGHTWAGSTTDTRAVQKAAGTDRIASCWYAPGSFTLDLNVTGTVAKQVSLYFLDWDINSRAAQVDIIDPATGALLSTQNVSGFSGGVYLKWNIKGKVQVRITRTAGANAVLSGVFFN